MKEEGSEYRKRFPPSPPLLLLFLLLFALLSFLSLCTPRVEKEKEREKEREREYPPEALDSPPHFFLLVSIELTECSWYWLSVSMWFLFEILIPSGFMLVFK